MYIVLVTRTEDAHTFTFVLDICLSKRKAKKICKQHQESVPTDICWLDMGGELPRYFHFIEEFLLWIDEHKASLLTQMNKRKS